MDVQGLSYKENMAVYAGDITTLNADAVVNSAAVNLTGCYIPLHNCIDNIVHSRAGIQLRNDCAAIIRTQGCVEEAGNAKITSAYNLPCRYILHTVGPRVAAARRGGGAGAFEVLLSILPFARQRTGTAQHGFLLYFHGRV